MVAHRKTSGVQPLTKVDATHGLKQMVTNGAEREPSLRSLSAVMVTASSRMPASSWSFTLPPNLLTPRPEPTLGRCSSVAPQVPSQRSVQQNAGRRQHRLFASPDGLSWLSRYKGARRGGERLG